MAALPSVQSGPVLQVFNRYLQPGGEEAWVRILKEDIGLPTCFFHSADWRGPDAPAAWRQALLMLRNPAAVAQLGAQHRETSARAWLFHNVFPVGSGALYTEAIRLGVPVIQYIHNFRPFSVSGYLWDGRRVICGSRGKVFAREIVMGAWQGSRLKTAWFATVLEAMHLRGCWRSVRAWLAISEFMRQHFIREGIPAERIFTLRHFHEPTAALAPFGCSGRYFLFLGRMIAAKGIRVLLQTWARLEMRLGDNFPELRLAGDGPLANWVADEARQMRGVRFLGHITGAEKAAQLAGCRAVLAPSIWREPFGLVVYEAYDYGKPILAARSGGLTELVNEGHTGWLHDPGNEVQLAEQVMELDAHPERAAAMGAAGRIWLETNARRQDWLASFHQIVAAVTEPRPVGSRSLPPCPGA